MKIKTFACLHFFHTLLMVFPCSRLIQALSVLTSLYLHQCSSTHFFLNPSNHFYFLAPLCKNINFKVINDHYITIFISQNADLLIFFCWFFYSDCGFQCSLLIFILFSVPVLPYFLMLECPRLSSWSFSPFCAHPVSDELTSL